MKKGFTLAEVLITLAIIGVVAAVAIPSVISNSNQQQYKTGLKKGCFCFKFSNYYEYSSWGWNSLW